MKKVFAILLVSILIFSLSACGAEDMPQRGTGNGTTATMPVQNDTEPDESSFGLDETAIFQNISVTATEIKKSGGSDFFEPDEGKIFVGVKFVIENTSSEDQSISTLLLFDAYADDVKLDYSISAAMAFDEGTLDGNVSPGKRLEGYYGVEVPISTQKLEFEVKSGWLNSGKAVFLFDMPN